MWYTVFYFFLLDELVILCLLAYADMVQSVSVRLWIMISSP